MGSDGLWIQSSPISREGEILIHFLAYWNIRSFVVSFLLGLYQS